MRTKAAVAILLLVIFALSSIAMIQIRPVRAAGTLTLSDTELYNEFGWKFDPGSSLTGKTDVPGPGVQFNLAGLGKAGICDDWEVSSSAGGSLDSYGHYSDFGGFDEFSMLVVNVGSGSIEVDLFMNTGFTVSGAWGTRDWHWDTFWKGTPVTLGAGESAILTLDFSSSYQAWNIADDPVYTGHTDGEQGTAIFRLNEVTCIGFEVVGSGSASVIASGTLTYLYINPPVVNKAPSDAGTTFDVNVTLENFANFAGFDINLTWNSNLITKTAVDYKTYLTTLWSGVENVTWYKFLENSGAGYYELVALALGTSASNTGASVLFKITFQVDRSCNFPLSTSIHFALVKLSDNAQPVPNPITATATDGMYYMSYTTPDLEFKVKKRNRITPHDYEYISPPYEFEYCDWFEVEVWVTDICVDSPLQDYDVTINFDPELAKYMGVDVWGTFGTGTAVESPPGTIQVSCTGGPKSGDFLLFALTFHVEFTCTPEHIWKYGNPNNMTFQISIADATLSFGTLGNKVKTEIIIQSPLTIQVNFIRGDVACDGDVDVFDLRCVAAYYGKPASARDEYDLNNDDFIDIYDLVTLATNFGYDTTP